MNLPDDLKHFRADAFQILTDRQAEVAVALIVLVILFCGVLT